MNRACAILFKALTFTSLQYQIEKNEIGVENISVQLKLQMIFENFWNLEKDITLQIQETQ